MRKNKNKNRLSKLARKSQDREIAHVVDVFITVTVINSFIHTYIHQISIMDNMFDHLCTLSPSMLVQTVNSFIVPK